MSSIRARLTAAYAVALVVTVLVFALVLLSRRQESNYEGLQRLVAAEADLALGMIRQTERAGLRAIEVSDTAIGPVITPTIKTLLEGMPGYLLILDKDGRYLYASDAVQRLSLNDLARFTKAARDIPTSGGAGIITVGADRVLMAARAPDTTSAIARLIVGTSTRSADLAVRELATSMLVVAPFLLVSSIAVAYLLTGQAFRPVDRIIDEVQAITDGRSLHRRLPVDDSIAEIGRLSQTLNEMMERLEKSFAALRRFTADASHELKTPLTVLRADVERAMNPSIPSGERLVALEEALHETTRMADLVDSLLTLARADEGRFDLHREQVPLEPLVRDVFETATILGEDAGLSVTMPAAEPVTVMGDATRLRQLFLNLVVNAIKYTPRGGSVELSLAMHGRTATFAVRDTGIGISAADLPHIFERFYRADRVRSRSGERGGFGLGLAISRWITEAHGGTISVRSRYGRGTTFSVTLPVIETAVESRAPAPLAEPASNS